MQTVAVPRGFWFVLACLLLEGCATVGPSVRALRAYDREQPTPELMRAHIRQMSEALNLIDELLGQTPYQPGASWIASLPLDSAKVERARALVADASEKASFVRVYVHHLRSVIDDAKRAPDALVIPGTPGIPVAAVPGYKSIRDALAGLTPGAVDKSGQQLDNLSGAVDEANRRLSELAATPNADRGEIAAAQATRDELAAQKARLKADLNRPLTLEDLRDPEHARIVQDALTMTSVSLRLALEAMSLATVVALEAVAIGRQPPKSWLHNARNTAELLADLPDDARTIYHRLEAAARGIREQLDQLAPLMRIKPLDAVGFQFKDGLVDDIVGFAWDSVHVDLQAGGEALYYAALADDEQQTDSKGNTYDYTGRLTRLEYKVEPIILAHAELSFKLDWAHFADAAGLKLGYATNRMYKSGGDIGTGSLASELGVKGAVSEALDAALAVGGVKSSVRIAHFTHGTVRDILVAGGSLLAEAPLTFDMTQIDLGYDIAPQQGTLLKTFTIGFRYFDYTLPRILYEFVNTTPGADHAAYVFSRETPPQAIRTRLYMADFAARVEKQVTPHFAPYLNIDFAVGYGPTSYYFLRDQNGNDVESNQDHTSSYGGAVGFAGAVGFRWRLAGPEARLNAYLDAYYHAQILSSFLDSKNGGDTVVNVGAKDVFHGPTAAFGLTF
jgi:hypothetical protein